MRKWLVEKRKNVNIKQNQLAKQVGITREYYSMIENDRRNPSVDVAKKLGKIMGFEWTIFFEEESNESGLNIIRDKC